MHCTHPVVVRPRPAFVSRRLTWILTAGALAIAPVGPASARAPTRVAAGARSATAPEPTKQMSMKVEVSLGGAQDDNFVQQIESKVTAGAAAHGIAIEPDAGPQFLVAISWANAGRSDIELRYFAVSKGGNSEKLRGTVCKTCGSSEALERLAVDLEALWPALGKAAEPIPAEPAPADEPTPPPVVTAPATTSPDATRNPEPSADTDAPRGGVSGMGIAGAALGTLGLGVGTCGVVFVSLRYGHPASDLGRVFDYNPAGFAMIGVGAALLGTGVALLAVDLKRAKRSRKLAAAPSMLPRGAGLTLAGRF
ncbi:MAG: hypothetical protein IPK74_39025 [Deltaproteobacteria bacterium]|nr:hypothetical protein [Deltaproteobacteria bacterium]